MTHRDQIERQTHRLLLELAEFVDGRDRLAIVKAPPGSGKTWLLLQVADHAFARGLRVAVAAQTNSQADDLCRRLSRDHPAVAVTRFARRGSDRPPDIPVTTNWVRESSALPARPSVTVSTTAKWGLVDIDPFDLVLVDEAWQMTYVDLALLASISERFVLIGDPGQIPPVVTTRTERWETSPLPPHRPAPDILLRRPLPATLVGDLPASRRLPHDTVDLILPFYDFGFLAWSEEGSRYVQLGRRPRDDLDRALASLEESTTAIVTLPANLYEAAGALDEGIAELAADAAVRLLDSATAKAEDDGPPRRLEPGDIGLTATHRHLNSAIEAALPSDIRKLVKVDTPERWQGLERDVMIAVHPLSATGNPSSFDLETGRLCVMASRHRAGLVVVSREHVPAALDNHIPSADQPLGQRDVTGRGHAAHTDFWKRVADRGQVYAAA